MVVGDLDRSLVLVELSSSEEQLCFLKHWYEGFKNHPDDYVEMNEKCEEAILNKTKDT